MWCSEKIQKYKKGHGKNTGDDIAGERTDLKMFYVTVSNASRQFLTFA